MKFFGLALALFCLIAYAAAQSYEPARFRREADPQGSIVLQAQKPFGGPERRPSLDLNYNHRVYDRNGMTADAFGGLNKSPGQPVQPHLGIQVEKTYRDGFLRGFGQVQRGHGGRPDPTLGLSGGFRFRRDADELLEEGQE